MGRRSNPYGYSNKKGIEMNLLELKKYVDEAIEDAKKYGEDPEDITVSIQIDDSESEALWSDDIELIYDNNTQASGCVLHGWAKK